MVALRKVPVHFACRGPTELRAPLANTLSQNTDGVKFAARLFVHTPRTTVGVAAASNFLQPLHMCGMSEPVCHIRTPPQHHALCQH